VPQDGGTRTAGPFNSAGDVHYNCEGKAGTVTVTVL
jgi:hypothetical protein